MTKWLALVVLLGACGDNTTGMGSDGGVAVDCVAVRDAFRRNEAACTPGDRRDPPYDCNVVTTVTGDVAACIAAYDSGACSADPACAGLFR